MLQAQIFMDEDDRGSRGPLHEYVMNFLLKSGIKGATLFRADFGFGARRHLHAPRVLGVVDERPLTITFIDETDKVRDAIRHLRPLLRDGMVVTHEVESW